MQIPNNMEKYILIFIINAFDSKGKQLLGIKDIINYRNDMIVHGFSTKSKMKQFINDYSSGIVSYTAYKETSCSTPNFK